MNEPTHQRQRLRATVVTGSIAMLGLAMFWFVVLTEAVSESADVNWRIFVVIAALLIACERVPRTWIRSGSMGYVTPLWMFSYALVLIGPQSMAVAVALVGTAVHAIWGPGSVHDAVLRAASAALALSTAALVLSAVGVDGTITNFDTVPTDWAAAIVLSGVSILLLNAIVAAIASAVQRNVSFIAVLKRSFGTRVTAEGALLSLAPIWVIGIDFSPVFVPLLGITTMLVFRSTRQALERSEEAQHDSLTGLPNRRAFLDHVDDALKALTVARPTILILDLNGFKEINDRLGHQVGDAVLTAFAERLLSNLPPTSVAARLGGDEFAVLVVTPNNRPPSHDFFDDLHEALTTPLDIEGFPVSIGVSIGVSTAPDDGRSTRDMLRAADVAMYRAKRTGIPIERYANCIQVAQRGRINLLTDLGTALDENQLHIHFQPQLRLSDGGVDAVEALVRWNHPEHGQISPGEFIGLAEQTDLIAPITEMMLRASSKGILSTRAHDLRLAVNVSSRSLQDPYFADDVFRVLAENGFPPERLEFEVTERALVTNIERSRYTIDQLREAGVRIAIDDFGVGYSSYQTLRLLNVDRVKIDRDFVQGLLVSRRDQLIVSSLIKLAHELGLDVVAEGVESTAIWNALSTLECDVAQGFGIAPPMPFLELRGWLPRWNNLLVKDLVGDHRR